METTWTIEDEDSMVFYDRESVTKIINNDASVRKDTVQVNPIMGASTERIRVGSNTYFLKTFNNTTQAPYEVELRRRLTKERFVKILAYSVSNSGSSQVLMANAGADCWDRDYWRKTFKYGPMMTPTSAYSCLWSMLSSLVVAEAAGVVHRDLKPENVAGEDWTIIDLSGAVDVSTFAERLQQRLVDQAVGTWGYMAPELQRFMLKKGGSKEEAVAMTTSKLDVYSFGAIGYKLLTGCLPPAAGRGPLTFPPLFAREWPHLAEVKALITSCLQADPQLRPTFLQLQQKASGWLQPFVEQARLASMDPTHPLRLANPIMEDFYSSKKVQAQLMLWALRANWASKPLPLWQRALLDVKRKLAARKQQQQQQQQQQQPAIAAKGEAAIQTPAQPEPAASAAAPAAQPAAMAAEVEAGAQPTAQPEPAAAPAAPTPQPAGMPDVPCSTCSTSSGSSSGSSVDVVCVIEVAVQPAAAKPAKGSKGKLASWGSNLKQRCAARLQRIDAFFTQHNPVRRGSRPVPVAAC